MAVNASNNPTLLDQATRLDPDGKIAEIVEILTETNEVLDDMSWMEGNMVDGHTTTIRTGLPTPTWRKMYQGVQPNKSTTAQIKDTTGMLEEYAEIDKALADLNNNTAAFRLSEDRAHIEGMSQEVAETLFYGNEGTEPEAFTGLSPRFNDLSAENADNIIDAGGTGTDNASVWLVVWGPRTCHGIFPKGSKAGLQMKDLGEVTIEDADGNNGGRMQAYRSHYRWDAGLTVRDWRFIVRIANIDKSLLSELYTPGTGFATGADLGSLMYKAMRLVPSLSGGRPAFYMARDIATFVSQQVAAKGNANVVAADTVSGDERWTERFKGIPMRRVDALAADEARVV